ncbi:monooxygenase [Actinoplanes flavus]|uniref:Monooxygenase n=1 Tax=Actinoplanes flavus TaxID=2820290 RepID=A0ABS3UEQ1_9ACTN|nr:monooxygenase [Actinoplanes flavus]MBO3737249.1 monooxygenase [Actinoplanes flavus]
MTDDLVSLHVWRVPRQAVGSAMLRMAFARRHLEARRRLEGLRFGRFLGTGTGSTFGPGDTDLTRWAAITVSDHPVRFPTWDRIAVKRVRLDLEPLVSRGEWGGVSPFRPRGGPHGGPLGGPHGGPQGGPHGGPAGRWDGMVLALTRARLRPSRALRFWRAVPAVAREVAAAPGLLARFGVGEAPIGWQGTVSVWRGAADLTAFAYRQPEHRAVIARTPTDRWYAEELFARFAVLDISGDRTVLGWTADEKERTTR